jgi:hypothetical protein
MRRTLLLEEAHQSQVAFLQAVTGKTAQPTMSPTMSLVDNGCDPADVAAWDEASAPPALADSPIFIVGFPRSGTTLLEQTLDAHPQLQVHG